jgi:hypothetical protein
MIEKTQGTLTGTKASGGEQGATREIEDTPIASCNLGML